VDLAIPDLPAGPVEQAHAAVSVDQPVLHSVIARANMLPSGQVFAIEKLLPFVGIALANILILIRGEGQGYQTGKQKNADSKSFQHGESPEISQLAC
jgi:hypothetical protein